MSGPPVHPRGADIIAAVKEADVEYIVALPDIVTSDGLLWPIARDPDLKLVRICKEDEGVSICAGLSYCDRRALLLIQQTGLLDSLNAVRAIALDYGLPICMMVGLQGKEPHLKPRQSAALGVRIIEPVLEAMELPYHLIEEPDDCRLIRPGIEDAYRRSRPLCFLVGRSPS